MSSSLDTPEAAKSVLNAQPVSQRERLHVFDDDEAGILGRVLADDLVFQEKCALVEESPVQGRRAIAEREASAYTPYRGAHRDLIIELLLAAAERWNEYPEPFAGPTRRFRLQNLKRRGIWLEDERPCEESAQRRRERWPRLEEGAQRLARFGAGRCIGCDRELAGDRYERGASSRAGRRWHCSPQCPDAPTADIRASHRESMRDALDAATGQRRTRRAARRRGP
jgi:hypothetical protein